MSVLGAVRHDKRVSGVGGTAMESVGDGGSQTRWRASRYNSRLEGVIALSSPIRNYFLLVALHSDAYTFILCERDDAHITRTSLYDIEHSTANVMSVASAILTRRKITTFQ